MRYKPKKPYTCYLDELEHKILEELKPLFSSKNNTIKVAIHQLSERYYDKIKNNIKLKKNKVSLIKKINKIKQIENSEKMIKNKLVFKDTKKLARIIEHSYHLFLVHGIDAKKHIIKNIKNMKKTFFDKDTKKKLSEFEYKIENNFIEMYNYFIETRLINKKMQLLKGKITYSDTVLSLPEKKEKK